MTLPASIIVEPNVQLSHHRIHEGRFFSVTTIAQNINIANPKRYMILSPPITISIAHVIIDLSVEPGARFDMFEGAIAPNNGISLGSVNQDRANPVIATGFAFEDPTVTSEGFKLWEEIIGSSTQGGVGGPRNRDEDELLFKPLTKYLMKITPLIDGTSLSIKMQAYRQGVI